jgi:hypothetical protein
MSQQQARREALLKETPGFLAREWAEVWFAALSVQGRVVRGGWPGTLSEARSRTKGYVESQRARIGMPRLTHEQLEEMTRTTYHTARRLWLRRQVLTPPEDPRGVDG